MTNTVIAYRAKTNTPGDARPLYVSHLPGNGADWGYTDDRAKALPLTVPQAKRFLANCEHCAVRWFGTQPALPSEPSDLYRGYDAFLARHPSGRQA